MSVINCANLYAMYGKNIRSETTMEGSGVAVRSEICYPIHTPYLLLQRRCQNAECMKPTVPGNCRNVTFVFVPHFTMLWSHEAELLRPNLLASWCTECLLFYYDDEEEAPCLYMLGLAGVCFGVWDLCLRTFPVMC